MIASIPFTTEVKESEGVIAGPLRHPRQMLAVQEYAGHTSIHDDATARTLGFQGGTIEGPTHFSQFAPLGHALWGDHWLSHGCLSVHYRAPAFEGDGVRAFLRRPETPGANADVWMERSDGTEILRGTASIGPDFPESALDARLASLAPLTEPLILADVRLGAKSGPEPVRMAYHQHMGALYPFTLAQKLERITEPSPWYSEAKTPWERPIVPLEMVSVLMQHSIADPAFGERGPAVGLFADQEIRLVDGPVFVDEEYQIGREVVAFSGSRRTESMWVRSTLYHSGTGKVVAMMLLNMATLKQSYDAYESERAALYGAPVG